MTSPDVAGFNPRSESRIAFSTTLRPFLNGAYAEFLLVPERIARVNLLPVPDGAAPEVAALLEPLACCLHGVERAGVRDGDTVAILGAGPIGLMLCACVADAGGKPILVGGRAERRELAPLFGARPGDGRGADVAIEAAGTDAAGPTRSRSCGRVAPPSCSAAASAERRSSSTPTGSTTRS